MAEVGFIDYQNKLHFYNPSDAQKYGEYLIGTTGVSVNQALSSDVLKSVNKPLQYDWSFSNLLGNVGQIDTGIKQYLLIGGVILALMVALK